MRRLRSRVISSTPPDDRVGGGDGGDGQRSTNRDDDDDDGDIQVRFRRRPRSTVRYQRRERDSDESPGRRRPRGWRPRRSGKPGVVRARGARSVEGRVRPAHDDHRGFLRLRAFGAGESDDVIWVCLLLFIEKTVLRGLLSNMVSHTTFGTLQYELNEDCTMSSENTRAFSMTICFCLHAHA